MNKQLKFRVFSYFLGAIIFVLLVIWVGIHFYIEDYYYGKKIEDMVNVADQIESIYEDNGGNRLFVDQFEIIGYYFGGKISVISDYSILTVYDKNVIYKKGKVLKELKYDDQTAYIFENQASPEVSRWLVYGRQLDDDVIVMLEIPVESIENTLGIIATFFNYLALISVVIAIIFSYILSRSISKPVIELNEVANDIRQLNFNARYEGRRADEIGQLGNTLNELTDKLEMTINDLTYELEKEKQLDVLRKQFVAQVSHELQTPLSVIKGYVEALEDGMIDDEEEKQYYYSIIEDETTKMSKLVKDTLNLSQLESGTFKFDNDWMDLREFLDRIADKFELIAERRHIKWQYRNDIEETKIYVDELRLEQGIVNIISNAFKHVIEEGVISMYAQQNNNTVILKIENDGQQIENSQLPKVWESFYKADTSIGKKGTGLGLAIAANIFKVYGIEYKAYNHINGVGFEVKIPKDLIE